MIAPVHSAPNVKSKTHIINWDRLPMAPCDLNFRLHLMAPTSACSLTVAAVTIAGAGVFAALSFQIVEQLATSTLIGAAMLLAACAVVLLSIGFGVIQPVPGLERDLRCASVAGGVAFTLFCLSPFVRLAEPGLAGLLLLSGIVFPALSLLADRFAMHFIYYMTAHHQIDRQTMTGWRQDWCHRFTGFPDRSPAISNLTDQQRHAFSRALALRASYRHGFLSLALAIAAMILIVRLLVPASIEPGLALGTVLTAALAFLAVYRSRSCDRSLKLFQFAVSHWLRSTLPDPAPPWIFHSPVGGLTLRRWRASLTVFVVASVLTTIVVEGRAPGAVVSLACIAVLAPVIVLLVAYIVAAPAISAHLLALRQARAPERHADWSQFDGCIERLRNSRNPLERKSLLLGFSPDHGDPLLLDDDLLFEHQHVMGATGGGKTTLGLTTQIVQQIRRRDGAVVVLDCKGDMSLFNAAREEAERAGATFKWFTNRPFRFLPPVSKTTPRHLRRGCAPMTERPQPFIELVEFVTAIPVEFRVALIHSATGFDPEVDFDQSYVVGAIRGRLWNLLPPVNLIDARRAIAANAAEIGLTIQELDDAASDKEIATAVDRIVTTLHQCLSDLNGDAAGASSHD